jgi:hypothetical protein
VTLFRDAIPSPNYSSRGSSSVTHIVVHTAEGALTYESLGHYFESPSAGVSSHVGIDDTAGVIGEYVRRDGKAWTASNANPWSVQAELCGFAEWDRDTWMRHLTMLVNTAEWIAEESAAYGIPIDDIDAIATDPDAYGVCQHNDLGAMGGGHWDCGPGFPVDYVLDLARGTEPPAPTPEQEDDLALHIIVGTEEPEWWLTDWITKRYLASDDEAAQIVVSTVKTGGKIEHNNNGPVRYDQKVIDRVPRSDT